MTRYVNGVPAAVAEGRTTLGKIEAVGGLATLGIVLGSIALLCSLPYLLFMWLSTLHFTPGVYGSPSLWQLVSDPLFIAAILGAALPAGLGLGAYSFGARHEVDGVQAKAVPALLLGLAALLIVVISTVYASSASS